MTTLNQHETHAHLSPSSSPLLSTAWMPLDGLTDQWGQFGTEATTTHALQATSAVFAALARETEALEHHLAAWSASRDRDVTDLERALDQLSQARQHWTEAILSLELLIQDARGTQTAQDAMHYLLMEAMQQRVRLCLLLHKVEREHLLAYQGLLAASHREGVSR